MSKKLCQPLSYAFSTILLAVISSAMAQDLPTTDEMLDLTIKYSNFLTHMHEHFGKKAVSLKTLRLYFSENIGTPQSFEENNGNLTLHYIKRFRGEDNKVKLGKIDCKLSYITITSNQFFGLFKSTSDPFLTGGCGCTL